jgi:hypothetical protein
MQTESKNVGMAKKKCGFDPIDNKVHRNFKLSRRLDEWLRAESKRRGRTQTVILENLLEAASLLKR